jgi:hypothetical protein
MRHASGTRSTSALLRLVCSGSFAETVDAYITRKLAEE